MSDRPRDPARGRVPAASLGVLALLLLGCLGTTIDAIVRSDAADAEGGPDDDGGAPDGADADGEGGAAGCRLGVPSDCPAGERCRVEGCLDDTLGTCVPVPDPCGLSWLPECGCDGNAYWNACELVRAGVARGAGGACAGTDCGPGAGSCPPGLVCATVGCMPGTPGTCVPPPSSCGPGGLPVCGCNGMTYPDACQLFRTRTPLDHPGECTAPPCRPECRTLAAGGTGWVDPCAHLDLCAADCAGCTSFCGRIGVPEVGWYVQCAEPTRDAGCGFAWNLIELTDCG